MNQQFLYLAINLGVISIPLLWSFNPRVNFYKKWLSLFSAIVLVGTYFLVWDEIFTAKGIWGFNPKYLMGIYLGHLPLEEILFFICIPYACIFTFDVLRHLYPGIVNFYRPIYGVYILMAFVAATMLVLNFDKDYTRWAMLHFFLLWAIVYFLKWPNLPVLLFSYLLIMPFFFLSNGLLTGSFIPEQVVWYSQDEFSGLRLFTIPLEDAFYGFDLILMNALIFDALQGNIKLKKIGGKV